eukprot:g7136.t1
MRFTIIALVVAATAAQYHPDPFSGSGCNCTSFCAGSCAINASKPANMTVYRMTPLNTDALTDKNTGDAPGDVSYVISRRTAAYNCKKDPSSFQCASLVVAGDDPDSTDLVIAFEIEVDGKWGPYLYCNPTDAKHPERPWNCTTSLSGGGGPPPGYPATCSAAYSGYNKFCFTGRPSSVVADVSLADCCSAAGRAHSSAYTYHATNRSCELHLLPQMHAGSCADGVAGVRSRGPPSAPPCECERVHTAVGRENLTTPVTSRYHSYHPAGGEWYSHPRAGQCAPGASVLGGGCSWRVVAAPRAVNASCVYDRLDTAVEATAASCFGKCPTAPSGGLNRTSDCYSECYSHATAALTQEQLTAPWNDAFGTSKPCPPVAIPNGMLRSLALEL